jgi:hypothetical protein
MSISSSLARSLIVCFDLKSSLDKKQKDAFKALISKLEAERYFHCQKKLLATKISHTIQPINHSDELQTILIQEAKQLQLQMDELTKENKTLRRINVSLFVVVEKL